MTRDAACRSRCVSDCMRAVLRYTMHLAVATLGAMLLAVPVVFACAAVTDVFRLGVTGTAYQRLGSTPPFVIQVAIAFVFGFAVAAWNANRDSAKWVWVVPTIWMMIALIAWKPVAGATES